MTNSDVLRMLSPLLFFVFHVVYLVAVSKDNFLNKWIDGSFTFFVALVLCNIIRSRLVAKATRNDLPLEDEPPPEEETASGDTPGRNS